MNNIIQKNIIPKPELGDFLFFYPSKFNLIHKIINRYGGKYVHCGYSLGFNLVISMTFNGVKIEDLEESYYNRRVSVYKLKDNDFVFAKRLAMFYIDKSFVSKYDYVGLFHFLFPGILGIPNRFYCSEYLAMGLLYFGYLNEPIHLSPTELANSECLEYCYDFTVGLDKKNNID